MFRSLLTVGLLVFCSVSIAESPILAGEILYSNEVFVSLLEKYIVSAGDGVDYAAWKESPEDLAALDRQVALLAKISPVNYPEPAKRPQAAFRIQLRQQFLPGAAPLGMDGATTRYGGA